MRTSSFTETVVLIYNFLLRPRIGKTLLAKTLARVVNVPFAIADATTLTQASALFNIIFHIMFILSFIINVVGILYPL